MFLFAFVITLGTKRYAQHLISNGRERFEPTPNQRNVRFVVNPQFRQDVTEITLTLGRILACDKCKISQIHWAFVLLNTRANH